MVRWILMFVAASGLLGVVIGAMTGHGDGGGLDARALAWVETALRWQFWHTAVLVGLAALAAQRPGRLLTAAAGAFVLGILLFAGSLHVMAFTGLRGVGMATPVGGLALMAGWALLGLHAFRLSRAGR